MRLQTARAGVNQCNPVILLKVCFDLRAKEMVTQVRKFANMPHGACVAVAILSHGVTDGRICGNFSKPKRLDMCSVSELTEALNEDALRHTPKVSEIKIWIGGGTFHDMHVTRFGQI